MEVTELQQRVKLLVSIVLLDDLLLLWSSRAAPSVREENTQRRFAKHFALSAVVESFSRKAPTPQEH
jgi:hypothetical protein